MEGTAVSSTFRPRGRPLFESESTQAFGDRNNPGRNGGRRVFFHPCKILRFSLLLFSCLLPRALHEGRSVRGRSLTAASRPGWRAPMSPGTVGPDYQMAVLRSEKPPKTAGLRRTASHRDLGQQGKGADDLTKQHRALHSRGQDAVRRHLESSQGSRRGTRGKSRRRQRTATFPGAFEDSERVVSDIRTIIPRLVQDPSCDPMLQPRHAAIDPSVSLPLLLCHR